MAKRIAVVFLTLALLAGSVGAMTPSEIYQNNAPAVVVIQGTGPNQEQTVGTGFLVSPQGHILTNAHVVASTGALTVTLFNGRSYAGQILAQSQDCDVALMKIEAADLPSVALGNADRLTVGEEVSTIGHPLGALTYTLTVGHLSGMGRSVSNCPAQMLQIDAAINVGNSGGPLFNAQGQVVGIVTAKYSGQIQGSTLVEGLAFALPINYALPLLQGQG